MKYKKGFAYNPNLKIADQYISAITGQYISFLDGSSIDFDPELLEPIKQFIPVGYPQPRKIVVPEGVDLLINNGFSQICENTVELYSEKPEFRYWLVQDIENPLDCFGIDYKTEWYPSIYKDGYTNYQKYNGTFRKNVASRKDGLWIRGEVSPELLQQYFDWTEGEVYMWQENNDEPILIFGSELYSAKKELLDQGWVWDETYC